MKLRPSLLAGGLVLILGALLMPDSWYQPLPQRDTTAAPPFSGFLLLRLTLIVEGALLLWLAWRPRRVAPIQSANRIRVPGAPVEDAAARRRAAWALAAITLLGLALRLLRLGSDLWLDEIQAVRDYVGVTPWQVFTSYVASNNHLLNTLLVNLSVGMFGQHEWAIRLPAALFGAATVPLLYRVAQHVTTRRASLAAAFLLAVSYHHIFFSQNARAYSAYVFFALAASVVFVRCLRDDRPRDWALYVILTLLNIASIVISAFVIAAHAAVALLALVQVHRQGGSPVPLVRRLATVFAVVGLLALQLYAPTLPQMYVYIDTIYTTPSAPPAPYGREFVRDLVRGLTEGFGSGFLFGAVPFLVVAAIGFISVARRNWPLILALALPGALQGLFLVTRQLAPSPRLFLLALPLAILVAVQAVEDIAAYLSFRLGRTPRFATWPRGVAVALMAALFIAPLPRYYATPKQAYRQALTYLASAREPRDIVVVLHIAETGIRYYGGEIGLREGEDCFYVRTVRAFDDVRSRHPGRRTWLIGTFPRALHLNLPDLEARVARDWVVDREFAGTIGDGVLQIWRPREPDPGAVKENLVAPVAD